MANNQTNRRKRDIKTKLMAAVSMLLVSSIMMVSTTYAWFTLSTAPEVKGITTAVGANGNLEMALMPADGTDPANSTPGDGSPDKTIAAKNITWGNLVDLSDTATYGLDKITLFPSELNLDTGSNTLAAAFLKTPIYGADGRVSELDDNTVAGLYNGQSFMPSENGKGVRAVGVASGMTDRQLDYRNARSAGNTAKATALNLASQSLTANGSALANIAIEHGMDGEESYSVTDVNALKTIVNDLNNSILPEIEKAYLQYILAYAASAATGTDDTTWKAVQGAVNAQGATLNNVITALGGDSKLPSELSTAIGKYNTTKSNVGSAKGELDSLDTTSTTATFNWDDISDPMTYLADTSAMTINGFKVSEVKSKLGDVVSSITEKGGLIVTMTTGAGVYADIADQCGDYSASVTIERVEYNGIVLNNMKARMNTETTEEPVYLDAISAAVGNAGTPAGGAAGTMPITDMYGYIIDLAFRTNAAESNLLLQVAAKDRIYSDNTNDDTMGGGSSMTFKATTTDFSDDQVKNLMQAIRIVFFDPVNSNKVIANAKLDANATQTADGWKADMYILDDDGTKKEDNVIMPLTQNTTAKLSVLVYLDGNNIGNDDVAATAASSMTGKMNIQFASSANLTPMEYADLHQGTGNNNSGASSTETNGTTEANGTETNGTEGSEGSDPASSSENT